MNLPRLLIISILFLLSINLFLYLYIQNANSQVDFHVGNYAISAHHFIEDKRAIGQPFELKNALGAYDAQWYLKIAKEGYPKNPTNMNMQDKKVMDGLSYAFFPLYPLSIMLVNLVLHNVETAGFVTSNLLMVLNLISLFYVVSKWYSQKTAVKTIILLFLFPFSIFYRSYFSEGLFLFLLIWYGHFLSEKKWTYTFICQSLLLICRPTGLFLLPMTLGYIFTDIRIKTISVKKAVSLFALSLTPFFIWLLYCQTQTGNLFYWSQVQSAWFYSPFPFWPLLHNLSLILSYPTLPFHDFHKSKIDILILFYTLFLLLYSKRFLKKEWWLISFSVWFFPLLAKDTISFARYQIISFPLFVYLAHSLRGRYFTLVCIIFLGLLLFTSLHFVNWWWIG